MLDACRFTAAAAKSANKKIMMVDCSIGKELYTSVLGETDCCYYTYRGIAYTSDIRQVEKENNNYDTIILYVNDMRKVEVLSIVNYIVFCYGGSRLSYERICRMLCSEYNRQDIISKRRNILLYRGEQKDPTVERVRHLISGEYNTYYVPKCDNDIKALSKMEYGFFDIDMLSTPMSEFLTNVIEVIGTESHQCQMM